LKKVVSTADRVYAVLEAGSPGPSLQIREDRFQLTVPDQPACGSLLGLLTAIDHKRAILGVPESLFQYVISLKKSELAVLPDLISTGTGSHP